MLVSSLEAQAAKWARFCFVFLWHFSWSLFLARWCCACKQTSSQLRGPRQCHGVKMIKNLWFPFHSRDVTETNAQHNLLTADRMLFRKALHMPLFSFSVWIAFQNDSLVCVLTLLLFLQEIRTSIAFTSCGCTYFLVSTAQLFRICNCTICVEPHTKIQRLWILGHHGAIEIDFIIVTIIIINADA